MRLINGSRSSIRTAKPSQPRPRGEPIMQLSGDVLHFLLGPCHGNLNGFRESFAFLKSTQQSKSVRLQSFEIDFVLLAVDREIDLPQLGQSQPFAAAPHRFHRYHVAGNVVCMVVRIALAADFQQQIVYRVRQIEKDEVRLKGENRIFAQRFELALGEPGVFRGVKGLYVRPFQPHHVQRQPLGLGDVARVSHQPLLQPCAEVAQGKGLGRALGQVRDQQLIELVLADDRAQTWKILAQCSEDTEPINLVINLKALRRGQPVIRLDDLLGNLLHGLSIERTLTHPLFGSEWLPDQTEDFTLKLFQVHDATADLSGTYLLAFNASLWTSSKDGIRSSHSSNVAVGPTTSMARAYSDHTGSITGWSCVSRMYFSYLECPAMWIWATRSCGTLLT